MKSVCTYCGKESETTDDHVIPRCLFVGPLPSPFPVVPACGECNSAKKSKDDSYLRDLLVMDLHCSEHPVVKKLMKGKFIRSVEKNRSEIARGVFKGLRRSPLYTSGGLYLGDYPSIPIDGDRVNEMLSRIIQGLYFNQIGKRLPDGYVFDIARLDNLYVDELMRRFQELGGIPQTLSNVFHCQFLFDAKDHGISSWMIGFYGGFFVRVHTLPPQAVEAA